MLNLIELDSGVVSNVEINQIIQIWRQVKIGLNWIDTCQNRDCTARDNEVLHSVELKGKIFFDLSENQTKINCPKCKKNNFKKNGILEMWISNNWTSYWRRIYK